MQRKQHRISIRRSSPGRTRMTAASMTGVPAPGVSPVVKAEFEAANESAKTPVVFIHGLWMLKGAWAPWRELFEAAGYATIAPNWPKEPETVEEARANPQAVAGIGVGEVADHLEMIVKKLEEKPAIIGHSFGGLFTQILAGRGRSFASVA